MTHIYQPIMIRTLLESDNKKASAEDIAKQFLGIDTSQINYYKKITKKWPHMTLKKHKIVNYQRKGEEYTLLLDDITPQQRKRLIEICNLRLQEFIDKDPVIRRYREFDERSKSGSLRYDIMAKSKGVCVACGIPATKAPLHVDHIVPISKMGKDEPDNMQALCYRCNIQKKNRDETDFMLHHKRLQFRKPNCKRCNPKKIILGNSLTYAVFSGSSYRIMPKRHIDSLVNMIPAEKNLSLALLDSIINHIKEHDGSVKDFDVFFDVPASHYAINIIPKKHKLLN